MQLVKSGPDGSPRRCAAPAALTHGHDVRQCHDHRDAATDRLIFAIDAESLMLSWAVMDLSGQLSNFSEQLAELLV